jgi:hypothetical protein
VSKRLLYGQLSEYVKFQNESREIHRAMYCIEDGVDWNVLRDF